MSPNGVRSQARQAFGFGLEGGLVVALVAVFYLSYRPVQLAPGRDAVLLGLLFVGPIGWSALTAVRYPGAPWAAGAGGYACLFAVLANLLALAESSAGFVLLCSSAGFFGLGLVGHAMGRRLVPGRDRCAPPQEPVCPHCGYGLYYARHHVCPDCGRPFRSADIDMRLACWDDGVLKPRDALSASAEGWDVEEDGGWRSEVRGQRTGGEVRRAPVDPDGSS